MNENSFLILNFHFSCNKSAVLEKSGTCEISKAKAIYKTELVDFIKFSDDSSLLIKSLSAAELSLAENTYDGISNIYQRIK